MYIYVTKFEGKPNLIKIGKSKSPATRNVTLSKSHGTVVSSDHYQLGAGYSAIEKYLHSKYSNYREQITGDGGSEFFSDVIYKDVSSYLNRYITEGYEIMDEDFISSQIKLERKRRYNLIGKLLGYKYSDEHTGERWSSYIGMWDIVKLESCYSLGFPKEEVNSKFITFLKQGHWLTRFTTPSRVALAYKLSEGGSAKEKTLEKLLTAATENNKKLLH